MSNDLNEAKQRLLEKLGPNYGVYIQLLGKWFRGLITKEEFDRSAKQLIEHNFVVEHNRFWLAFFHHCANSESSSIQSHSFRLNTAINKHYNQKGFELDYGDHQSINSPHSTSAGPNFGVSDGNKVRCLPNKVITHMKIFVIAWEMGLDSASDHVSLYINLALQQFLKNIIMELICTKTAYRLRENRFKYAIGVKPMNPYLNNSLKIYSSNLEYDPYQIESNKMNSSLVDTYAYNDSLFPSRLYEAQALYEYACSTTSVAPDTSQNSKRLKLSEIFLSVEEKSTDTTTNGLDTSTLLSSSSPPPPAPKTNGISEKDIVMSDVTSLHSDTKSPICNSGIDISKPVEDELDNRSNRPDADERKLSLFHLLMAFLSNRTIIPSQSLYSINLERIFTKLSC